MTKLYRFSLNDFAIRVQDKSVPYRRESTIKRNCYMIEVCTGNIELESEGTLVLDIEGHILQFGIVKNI